MRTRRKRDGFRQPTLVPLADMLCNTLGIVIFIMVFTVLTSGGAVIYKVFPRERNTGLNSMMVICRGNRICPISETVDDEFGRVAQRFNRSHNLDELLKWTYKDKYCSVSIQWPTRVIESKPENGDTPSNVQKPESALNAFIRKEKPSAKFVYFIVYPDSLAAFDKARDTVRKAGFQTGWSPSEKDKPIGITFVSTPGSHGTPMRPQ